MSKNDLRIKKDMNSLLEEGSIDQLVFYMETVPIEKIHRHLYILSEIFPHKIIMSQKEFELIRHILTHNKFLEVGSISDFIRAINVIHFNQSQQKQITDLIFSKINLLSRYCHFELHMLITKVVTPEEFIHRIMALVDDTLSPHLTTYLLSFMSEESEFLRTCPPTQLANFKKLLTHPEAH